MPFYGTLLNDKLQFQWLLPVQKYITQRQIPRNKEKKRSFLPNSEPESLQSDGVT